MENKNAVLPTDGPPKRGAGRPRRPVPADQVRALRSQGLSFRAIARQTGYGYGSVRRAFLGQCEDDTVRLSPP